MTLNPFRVHFEDPELAPFDVEALDADDARARAAKSRGVGPAAIRKVKIIREKANG